MTRHDRPQADVVAVDVVGLVLLMRLGLEARRMNIGPRARQNHPIDDVEQRGPHGLRANGFASG